MLSILLKPPPKVRAMRGVIRFGKLVQQGSIG